MSEISGRCLCGAVSFTCEVPSGRIINCHCEDCRKATGAAHATLMFVPEDKLTITGETKTYSHTADSGTLMVKHFCGTCGSPMFSKNTKREGVIGIRSGVVSESDQIKPMLNIFTESMVKSTPLDPDLPTFPRMPG